MSRSEDFFHVNEIARFGGLNIVRHSDIIWANTPFLRTKVPIIHYDLWFLLWFVLISLWVCSWLFHFFPLFKEPHSLAHHLFVLEHWTLPNESTSLDPSCKIETNVFPYNPPFQLYTCELNFGQTIWGKTHVLLGTSWGQHF